MAAKRELVLDAAIEVLGVAGIRALTHRAADKAAELPEGTTSNYFRSKEGLLRGIVERLETLDRADWEALRSAPLPTSRQDAARALAEYVQLSLGPHRSRTAARYALFLAASSSAELREPLAAGRSAFVDLGTRMLTQLGVRDPTTASRILTDQVDGAILHQLAMPTRDYDPRPAIERIVLAL
ncbi:TetR family transcriptional regulator [Saxibacter everestensis]|uniref:TetR family transcriptional regulator n=1 Tax=Saxibacter everestensis TaxID=2909229 RepID=A0ABY8QY22_9MICO|nr:TetR family transcriptional regulator [Brevibacteriaceae bacterium ZFBP1038]